MKGKLLFKPNRKIIGIFIILLTVLYLVLGTVFAQDPQKLSETGITYKKEHLSYGDVWAFDSTAHGQSNYRRNSDGTFKMNTDKSTTKNYTRYFYSTVTTNGYNDPTGTTMVTQVFTRFNSNQTKQATVSSPVNDELTIPVMEATANNALYSVVPDTVGDYYVYAYSESGVPTTMFYSMLNSPDASNAHTGAGTVTSTLDFEDVGNNWYRAKITVDTVRWHAVQLNCSQKTGSHTNVNNVTGGQDIGTDLATTTYYNNWSTSPVYYNTVIIFKFNTNVKLGPVTKTGDTLTINNPDTNKGEVTAKTIFGEEIEIGKAVTMPHCPVIISGEGSSNGDTEYMLNEVKRESGSGDLNASDDGYLFNFEDTSVISVSWTKQVKLPLIKITGGMSDVTMNFFGNRMVELDHPGGEEKTYTFTADFDDAKDLGSLTYSYKFNGIEEDSGTLTQENDNLSFSNICYDSVEVTFTATDKDGDTYTATCTITLPDPKAETAPFKVGNTYYWTWEKAVGAAASGSNKTVVLVNNYTLPDSLYGNGMLENGTYVTESGGRINYRLPNGVTFIAPYDATGTTVNSSSHKHPYANEKQVDKEGKPNGHWIDQPVAVEKSVYRTLTVSSGASINLENNSTMAVGGNTEGAGLIHNVGDVTHSNIKLEANSEINVKSGARLSACGYIYGEGTVTAESGSHVYMPFSALDFRGGGYTVGVSGPLANKSGLSTKSGETGLAPFLRYCMNAIQAKLIVKPGATVMGYLNLVADGSVNNTNSTIIGSGGLIEPSGATIEITYDPDTYASTYSNVGKTKVRIYGDASFGSLVMNVSTNLGSATIDTAKANFPIPYNYDIEIASGTFTVPNAIMLLPGAKVTVDEGATLNATASITVYDGLHDYTSVSGQGENNLALKGWESGAGNPQSKSTFTNTITPSSNYPSTAVLQGASFGGSGSADLIINGTLNLNSGTKIGGIIQTGSSGSARINTASGITTSTTTQIGAVGSYSASLYSYSYAGATVRTMTGEILDSATGKRTTIQGGKTYYPSAGAGNISSYKYTLYYDSSSKNIELTEEVACILQGSWYNYTVNVHTVKDGEILETAEMHFAHGSDASRFYTNLACTTRATTVTGAADLYFDVNDSEAKIVWANGDPESYYMSVRNAVQAVVNKGDRIVLLNDLLDFSSIIGPMEGQEFIFDMNGKTINYRSTPFTSMGGKLTVDVNRGTITNVVSGKHYDSPVLSLNDPDYSMVLLLNGGTISVTGNDANPLVNGGVENAGDLFIDLGGGKWEYKTGVSVPKSEAAANQHHDLTVLAKYQSKAMFNNAGVLTIKDSKGGGTITTNLISNGTTLTAATPTTNYVSLIRNNAGAKLYLGGGELKIEPAGDADGDAILSTAAAPIPEAVYSAVILNFGDIETCDDATSLSMTGSGGYILYNFKGGTVDLDLRGGNVNHTPYDKGVAANAAMYSGKAAIINDGTMTLKDSTRNGKLSVTLTTTSGSIYGIYNNTNSAFGAILTIEGINIETSQTLNNNCYGMYNGPAGTIVSITDCTVKVANGQALRNYGSNTNAALRAKLGDIIGSDFIAGGASVATDGVVGSHALHNYYSDLGNISSSTFKSAGASALYSEASAAVPISMGDITDSHFEGAVYGLNTTYTGIGHISNSDFTGGTYYALSVGTNSTIESIIDGKFSTKVPEGLAATTYSGGLNMAGTGENKNTGVKRTLATIGGISDAEFDVYSVGINISHSDIGNLNHVIIKTQSGNGITAANGCVIGDVTNCKITSGVYDEDTGTFTTGATALSTAGVAGTATADVIFSEIGNITDSTFIAKTYGISTAGANAGTAGNAAGSMVGNIVGCIFNTGSNGINIAGGAVHATGGAAAAPTVGNIVDCNITSGAYGISISGHAGNANFPAHAFASVGDFTGNTINSGTVGIYLTYAKAGKIEDCHLTAKNPANTTGVVHVINLSSVEYIKDTDITILETCVTTSSGLYVSGSEIGAIGHCTINALGSKGYAITNTTTAALGVSTIGNITDCTIKSNANGIYAVAGAATATMPAAAIVFGDIINTTFDTVTYGISMAGAAANATGGAAAAPTVGNIIHCTFTAKTSGIYIVGVAAGVGGAAAAPTVGNITDCTFTVGTYGINIGGGAVHATGGAGAAPTVGDITDCTINAVTYGIQIAGAAGNANFPHAFATVGDITDTKIYAGTSATAGAYYGIYFSYANAGKIEECTFESGIAANSTGVIHVTNRSSVEYIQHTDITVRATSTNTSTACIYTSSSTIGDIIHCKITSSKGPAISHNATAALGVSTIGNITNCTVVSGAGGIAGASGQVTATAAGAAPVIGDIIDTTFDTVTYGINITGSAATANGDAAAPTVGNIIGCTFRVGSYGINISGGNAVAGTETTRGGVAAGPTVGKIDDCTVNAVTYGIQIVGGAGTLANNYADVGFAKVGDITGTIVNSGTYSILLNYCKGGVIEDCELNAVSPASNAGVNFVLGNLNGSEITCIVNTPIKVTSPAAKVYGIYNNGGEIGLIEKSPIDAPYGIYNANTRSSTSTATSGEFVVYAGHIGTIKDTDITVAQYAIANRGVIDEIIGKCTFIASNPSAQVPSGTARYANSNVPGYTIYNYNTWWADQTLWRRTDTTDSEGHLTRTDEYLWDDDHRPTIGKISGDIRITALNTSGGNNAQNNGVAMVNNGVIREISGNVVIETYVHPDNNGTSGATPPTYSAYALQNIAGGRIDKITGNVKISAGAYAIQNTSASTSSTTGYAKTITTYAGTTATTGQETSFVRDFHWDYTGIGEITGDNNETGIVIEATAGSYALENHAHIGDITGKVTITADNGAYALQNTTGTAAYVKYTYSWPGLDPNGQKIYYTELLTATIGTIGGSDSEILIRSASSANNTYTLHNSGRIEAIINATVETTKGNTTTPAIYNAEASWTLRDSVYTNLGYNEVKSWYDTVITRDYVYERSSIGKIDGVTVTTAKGYALRNAGDIESITNSSFTAVTGYGIDNILGGYAQEDGKTYSRESVQYYHGTTALAESTQYFGETNIWYTRKQATVGLIDNVAITVESGSFGIQNAGIIDKITNSTITVLNNDAICNTGQAMTGEDVSKMENYVYLNASGNYVVSAATAITDKIWTYELPKINLIGEGNTIQAAARAIENKGIIGAIGDENGKRTTITATSQTGTNQQAIYNYDGFVSRAERDNSTTTVNTYANATIGTIKNVSVSNGITPAIQNGASSANYYPVIEEIGEGTEVHSIAGMAVSNYTTNGVTNNAKILKITGGIFTTEATGNFYALYNYSTVNPIEITDGYFKSGSGDRVHAIYLPDDTARYIYPEDMLLSSKTRDAIFADGTTISGYYFITESKFYITFNGNGALNGGMDQMEISLSNSNLDDIVILPNNGFYWMGYSFKGWAKDQNASEVTLNNSWIGTVSALCELLGGDIHAEEEITLYAIWAPYDVESYRIEWGDMGFTYTRPEYVWDAWNTRYEQTNFGEAGWKADEENTIRIMTGENSYNATLTFERFEEEAYSNLGMNFIDSEIGELENGTLTIDANGEAVITAMLHGIPKGEAVKAIVGTIKIVLAPNTEP